MLHPKLTLFALISLSLYSAAFTQQPETEPTTAPPSTSDSLKRINTLLVDLYPEPDGVTSGTGGLPGQVVVIPPEPAESDGLAPSTVSTRLVVRRAKSDPTSQTQTEDPAVDLTLLNAPTGSSPVTTESLSAGSNMPALPPGLRPEATPHLTPLPAAEPVANVVTTETKTTVSLVAETTEPENKQGFRRVKVNHAGEAELAEALRLDARRARYVIEFRELYGPFHSPDDLDQVTGLPGDIVRKWEQAGVLDFE